MNKIIRAITAFVLIACLVLIEFPGDFSENTLLGVGTPGMDFTVLRASAEEAAAPSVSVTLSKSSVTPGSSFTATVKAADFSGVAGAKITLRYNADVFDYVSTSVGSFISGQTYDTKNSTVTNEATESSTASGAAMTTDGFVTTSFISADGVSGSGNIITVSFKAKSGATAGTYDFSLTVEDVYDTSINDIAVTKSGASITVNEAQTTVNTVGLYASCSSSGEMGDTVTYVLSSNNLYNMATANFCFTYDSEYLEYKSCSVGSCLTTSSSLYSINSSTTGLVKVTYVSDTAPSANYSNLITLTFEIIKDVDAETVISFSGNNFYDVDLNALKCNSIDKTVSITKKPVVVDYPDIFLTCDNAVDATDDGADTNAGTNSGENAADGAVVTAKEYAEVTLSLEKDTEIGAADFVVHFDSSLLSVAEVTVDSTVSENGGQIVTSPRYDGGVVKFSYINVNGLTAEQKLIHIKFDFLTENETATTLTVTGTGVVDSTKEENDVTLEYKSLTLNLVPEAKPEITGTSMTILEDRSIVYNIFVQSNVALGEEWKAYYRTYPERLKEDGAAASLGEEIEMVKISGDSTGYVYKIRVKVAPKNLSDYIEINLYEGEDKYSSYTSSPAEYAETILSDTSGVYSASNKHVLLAMINYGSAAQEYFDYETANLSNSSFSESQKGYGSDLISVNTFASKFSSYSAVQSGNVDGMTYGGSSLILDSSIGIRHYFVLDGNKSASDYTVKAYAADGTEIQAEVKNAEAKGLYFTVTISGIGLGSMDEAYTLKITDSENEYAFSSSVFSYYNVAESSMSEELKDLLMKMYIFERQCG